MAGRRKNEKQVFVPSSPIAEIHKQMKITFCLFDNQILGHGVRILVAILKRQGHSVRVINACDVEHCRSDAVKDEFLNVFADTDIYLFSLVSYDVIRAILLTDIIKSIQPGVPIVWGGVHPSALPEDSLRYADHVGLFECDEALPEFIDKFARGEDVTTVSSFWSKRKDGSIIKNPIRPPLRDISLLPPPDHRIDNDYVLREERLFPMSDAYLADHLSRYLTGEPTYMTAASRGCPNSCAYCFNSMLKEHSGYRHLRFRSLPQVILEEIKPAVKRYPFIKKVFLCDDDFLVRGIEEIRIFRDLWKREVNLPYLINARPESISPGKIDLLVDSGLYAIEVGVQSGSERLNREVYKRPFSRSGILDAARILDHYVKEKKIGVVLDFILDCPYETDSDILESISLYRELPKSMQYSPFVLNFFPGAALYQRALGDKIIDPSYKWYTSVWSELFKPLSSRRRRYLTYVFMAKMIFGNRFSDRLFDLLVSPVARYAGNHAPQRVLNRLQNIVKQQTFKLGLPKHSGGPLL